MLNCFKDYERHLHILKGILDLDWFKKLTLGQQYMSVLHSQFHVCRCSGNFRSLSISRQGIDPQSQNIPGSEELKYSGLHTAKSSKWNTEYMYHIMCYLQWKLKQFLHPQDVFLESCQFFSAVSTTIFATTVDVLVSVIVFFIHWNLTKYST